MVHAIAYDLNTPGQAYSDLIDFIKSASGGHCHAQYSLWFVDSTNDQAWWRDHLQALVDANDKVFVARITRAWASYGMGAPGRWLNDPPRRW